MFRRLFTLIAAAFLAGSGCSTLAKKTPTPADDITTRQAAAITAPPGERYFLLIFGSQTRPKRPKYTHTWATIVKVTGCDEPGTSTIGVPIEEHTISWLPASLDIRPLSFRIEPGVNLDLHATIKEMLRNDEEVAVWGPYEVGAGTYYRFQVQKGFMDSGTVGYQCIDAVGEASQTGNGCDCIHAVTDMDPQYARNRYPLSFFGEGASRHIVHQIHIRPLIIDPGTDHGWLLPLLGLDKYPIMRRNYFGRVVPRTPENVERFLRRADRRPVNRNTD